MSTVTFRHEKSCSEKTKKGNKTVKKEKLIDGEKGLSFSFVHKDGDDKKFYKVSGRSDDGKTFIVTEKNADKETTSEKSKKDVESIVKKNKDLEFARVYMTKGASAFKSLKKSGAKKTQASKNKNYFVKHCKQEMHNYNSELAECEGWEIADMIDIDFHKGEYHEVMFGPFDKKKAESIFCEIKDKKNLHYSITQGDWEETVSIHGKKGIKRTTGYNYHDEGYYYEYLSIENPLEQATNMSVDEWLKKMDMEECLEKGLFSSDDD